LAYVVRVRDGALDDLRSVPRNIRDRIVHAIEKRLAVEPARYGVRLRRSLLGLWRLRVGDYRVVYEIKGRVVTVWVIMHRKQVYVKAGARLGRA